MTLDDGDAHWFAASRTGLTDMKLHGNTFRFEATQKDCSKGSLGKFFVRKRGRFAMASHPTDDAPSTSALSSFQMSRQ
jgi:hypothetical protein